jgi:[acyl-carrier-protein] S-malonyltransferase
MEQNLKPGELFDRLESAAFAFRGYNTTNLGRSGELLAHRVYGPVVERHLQEASEIYSSVTGQSADLVSRVRNKQESTLETFGQDIGLIIALELAQLEILQRCFDIHYRQARLGLGYSLGEVTAMVAGGVYTMRDVLPPLMSLAAESADLARDVTMGIVFSRGPALDLAAVEQLCLEITSQGRGVIAVSAYLSPNTVLLLGQADTVDRFKDHMTEVLDGHVHLRKNQEHWPPLHTPLLWQRNIPNRAAVMMQTIGGGFRSPTPPVLSLVTGKVSYNDHNSREILNRWVDHPQRLWDAVYELLAGGIEVVVHVGPDPNLLPATFKRLSDNVTAQLASRSLNSIGMRAMSNMVGRPWLAKLLSARAALLRAPFLEHVVLEDWLLAQDAK